MSETTAIAPLVAAELATLNRCEDTIRAGLKSFIEVGEALTVIRDKQLYRQEHATFEEYCRGKWQMSASRARQLSIGAKVAKSVTNVTLTNEGQARELAKVPAPQRQEVVEKAAEATNGKVTAAAIREASPPPPRSLPSPIPDRPATAKEPAQAPRPRDQRTFGERCADTIFRVREIMQADGKVMTKADVARVIDDEFARRDEPESENPEAPVTTLATAKALIGGFRRYSDKPWRREGTPWSDKETKVLRAILPIAAEDMLLMSAYYSAKITPKDDFRRRDIATLLNNWTGELDRARGWKANTPEAKPAKDYTRI